jgi:hypothetical protein
LIVAGILLFWVALLLDPQSFDPVAIRGFHLCFDDEVISLLYLGVQRSRDAMTFGASKTEALDGSPVPLGSTATHEPIEIPRSLWGRWKSLDDHRDAITSLWIEKQSNPKQKNTSDNQQPSEGQAVEGCHNIYPPRYSISGLKVKVIGGLHA